VARGLAVVVMALAGGIVAIQPALNSGLGRAVGPLPAAMMSFAIGAIALLALVVLTGQLTQVGEVTAVSWPYLVGGLLGALWVICSITAVKSIGVSGVVAATISGQLTGAVVADRLGIFGLTQIPITPVRIIGVLLLVFGTYLVVR
jgi:transporter family-2 protein